MHKRTAQDGVTSHVSITTRLPWALRLAILAASTLTACGGGGNSGSAAPAAPTSLADTRVAIKVVANLLEASPLGIGEAYLEKSAPTVTWAVASSSSSRPFAGGTRSLVVVNADGAPSVGDSETGDDMNTMYRHLSGTLGTFTFRYVWTLGAISDPATLASGVWTSAEDYVGTAASQFGAIDIAGHAFDQTNSGSFTRTWAADHRPKGMQVDTATLRASGTETSSLGASSVTVSSNYTCTYPAGVAASCDTVNATLTGTVYGLPISATMTKLAGTTPSYEIDAGAGLKWVVSLVTYDAASVRNRRFSLRLPSGELIALTGEDTNWLRIGF
jgi:hypothetical protein